MSDTTKISWTDSTHNFWRGCTKVSDGCKNCYAETLVTTRLQGEWGKGKPRVRLKDFDRPVGWNKKPWICDECGEALPDGQLTIHGHGNKECSFHRRRVFSLSLGDIGDPEVSWHWFQDAMDVVCQCQNLTWQLLTKRPDEFLARWNSYSGKSLPENVWMGTSVENQAMADLRIPQLLSIPAKIRFLSVEPMLENIDLDLAHEKNYCGSEGIHWVIFGGESGAVARPCNIEWIRDGVRQCQAAGVPVFVKQLGSRPVCDCSVAVESYSSNCVQHFPSAIRDKKGGDMSEWSPDLRVRQFPS